MRETIALYMDSAFLNSDMSKKEPYFEYLLSGNDYQVKRITDLDSLEAILEEKDTKLLLYYMDEMNRDRNMKKTYLSVLSCLRSITKKPILVISEWVDERFAVECLSMGADDYCDKTCSPLELIARIKNQIHCYNRLCQVGAGKSHKLTLEGGLEMDDIAKQVTVEGRHVKLTPLEYKILYLLMQYHGRVLSNKQIYESIWHMEPIGADNTIAVHIRHLREKIEEDPKQPKWVQVVWGQGYKVG